MTCETEDRVSQTGNNESDEGDTHSDLSLTSMEHTTYVRRHATGVLGSVTKCQHVILKPVPSLSRDVDGRPHLIVNPYGNIDKPILLPR